MRTLKQEILHSAEELLSMNPANRKTYLETIPDKQFFEITKQLIDLIIKKGIKSYGYFACSYALFSKYEKNENIDFDIINNMRVTINSSINLALCKPSINSASPVDLLYSKQVSIFLDSIPKIKISRSCIDFKTFRKTASALASGVTKDEIGSRFESLLQGYNAIHTAINDKPKADALMLCISNILKGYYIFDHNNKYKNWYQDSNHNATDAIKNKVFNLQVLLDHLHFLGVPANECIDLNKFFEFLLCDSESYKALLDRANINQNEIPNALEETRMILSILSSRFIISCIDQHNARATLEKMKYDILDAKKHNTQWSIESLKIKSKELEETQSAENRDVISIEASESLASVLEALLVAETPLNLDDCRNIGILLDILNNCDVLQHVNLANTNLKTNLELISYTDLKCLAPLIIWRTLHLHLAKKHDLPVQLLLSFIMKNEFYSPVYIAPTNLNTNLDNELYYLQKDLIDSDILCSSHEESIKRYSRFYNFSDQILSNFSIRKQYNHCEIFSNQTNSISLELINFFINLVHFTDTEYIFTSSDQFSYLISHYAFKAPILCKTLRNPHIAHIIANQNAVNALVVLNINNKLCLDSICKIPLQDIEAFLLSYTSYPEMSKYILIEDAFRLYQKEKSLVTIKRFIRDYVIEYGFSEAEAVNLFRCHDLHLYKSLLKYTFPKHLIIYEGFSLDEVACLTSDCYRETNTIMRAYDDFGELQEIIMRRMVQDTYLAKFLLSKFFYILPYALKCRLRNNNDEAKNFNISFVKAALKEIYALHSNRFVDIDSYIKSLFNLLTKSLKVYAQSISGADFVKMFVSHKQNNTLDHLYLLLNTIHKNNEYKIPFEIIAKEHRIIDLNTCLSFFANHHYSVNMEGFINTVFCNQYLCNNLVYVLNNAKGAEFLSDLIDKRLCINIQLSHLMSNSIVLGKYQLVLNKENVLKQIQDAKLKVEPENLESLNKFSSVKDLHRLSKFIKGIMHLQVDHGDIINRVLVIYATSTHKNFFLETSHEKVDELAKSSVKHNQHTSFSQYVESNKQERSIR